MNTCATWRAANDPDYNSAKSNIGFRTSGPGTRYHPLLLLAQAKEYHIDIGKHCYTKRHIESRRTKVKSSQVTVVVVVLPEGVCKYFIITNKNGR